jgi:predicted dehydrogenase/threonine dehydrogenase-like Zn-dependent dehydrogenase
MKQILQSLRSGSTEVADVPAPAMMRGQLLIRTTRTLVSVGTEKMLVNFGQASLVGKARAQPEKVRQVIDKIRTDGLVPTIEAVFNKLDQPLPLGYSNVGVIIGVGEGVSGFSVGDRVVSNGKHAEVVSVPKNLCAKVPDGVTDEEAAFAVVGAIALQGLRIAQPTLGESVVVTGLGLIGLMAVQLLRAQGCRVLGIDYDESKLALASRLGAQVVNLAAGEDPIAVARRFSRDRGVDAVLITATTDSNEPVHQAATMCRKRGRIVLVGVAGLELSRADFYTKELSFQVSCSYGPGRYDPAYEELGNDYPVGFVRWTEQRNFEAVLDMMSERRIDARPLISHRFSIGDATSAYRVVTDSAPSLGILLEYPTSAERPEAMVRDRTIEVKPSGRSKGIPATVGFIGAGNYATAVLIPAFKATGARLRSIASNAGVSGLHAAKKFGFEETTTDSASLLADPAINAVVITTRHDSHAQYVCETLRAGKHVFVEKPLAISESEVDWIEQTVSETAGASPLKVMVGFNRRFAPQVKTIRELLARVKAPKVLVMMVNAGAIPADHWTQDRKTGGGRIVGEACHFIDLLRYLVDSPITAHSLGKMDAALGDTATIQLAFADGSIGTVHYLANGSKRFPKERLEIFANGGILQLDNFRRLTGYGWPGFSSMNLWRQDKGHKACATAFVDAVSTGAPAPIPLAELLEISRVAIALGNH